MCFLLCRDVLGNLPRMYFGKSRTEPAWMKEASISPHKYINAGTEKNGWDFRLTSNHNRELHWPFVWTSEKDRIPKFSFRTNCPAWSHHSTYRQGSTGLRKQMCDFVWFPSPVVGQPAICNENLKASTVRVLAKSTITFNLSMGQSL